MVKPSSNPVKTYIFFKKKEFIWNIFALWRLIRILWLLEPFNSCYKHFINLFLEIIFQQSNT